MKKTQTYKAEYLGLKQPQLSMLFSGKRKLSWPLAVHFSKMFPEKTIEEWKTVSPIQLEKFLDANIPNPE